MSDPYDDHPQTLPSARPATLGGWLAYLRRQAHWTQLELAEAAGLSAETVSHIERGVVRAARGRGRGADATTRALLAQALQVRFAGLAQQHGGASWLTAGEAATLSRQVSQLLTALPGKASVQVAEGLARSARAGAGLPIPLSAFVGRVAEQQDIAALLARPEARLVTLTGPGGVGKTRLALQVAHTAGAAFEVVQWVDLVAIREPALVLPAIAQALGVREEGGRGAREALQAALGTRRVLLVLDNCEQVRDAGPAVSSLLSACAGLVVLTTGRARWQVQGEYEYSVPPLTLPDLTALPDQETLEHCEAVALFAQRARTVQPAFALTGANAATVAAICVRLDGLPLAIELAAAQLKLLPPRALLARLGNRLALLQGGPRDLPERQQTLRATLAWSYDLLRPAGQTLFRRLAVFAGGCTLDAAESVCAAPGDETPDVLAGLSTLVDTSQLRALEQSDGEMRFSMLETVREYGLERLEESGEAETLRQAHAAYYLALAERAASELTGPDQAAWIRRLDAERDNLRQALAWARDNAAYETGVRLAGALYRFWDVRGYLSEGRQWLDEMLACSSADGIAAPVRAKALYGASVLAYFQSDYEGATAQAEEALSLYRASGDRRGLAATLMNLGNVALDQSRHAHASALYEESLILWRDIGDSVGIAIALDNLALVARKQGDYSRAAALCEESLTLHRALGNKRGAAKTLGTLGQVARDQGDLTRAEAWLRESLEIKRELGDMQGMGETLASLSGVVCQRVHRAAAAQMAEESFALFDQLGDTWGQALALRALGRVALDAGEWTRAEQIYQESLSLSQAVGDTFGVPLCLEGLAAVACAQGRHAHAARLCSAAEAQRVALGTPRAPADQAVCARITETVRAALDPDAYASAWASGQTSMLEQVLDECKRAIGWG